MAYKKAEDVLPQSLLAVLQNYVDGEYLYIPRKGGARKAWGERNGGKSVLLARNREIALRRQNGAGIGELAAMFFLSEKTVAKIIASMRSRP